MNSPQGIDDQGAGLCPNGRQEERNSGFYDEKAERMDRTERAAFKEKEALRILRYAYENAPGYRKFLDERGITPGQR